MNPWLTLGVNVLLSTLHRELYAAIPRASYAIIRHQTLRLPAEIRDRYLEEWLAESQEYAGSGMQLVRALSLMMCDTAAKIGTEYDHQLLDTLDERLERDLAQLIVIERQVIELGQRMERGRTGRDSMLGAAVHGLKITICSAIDVATGQEKPLIAEQLSELKKSIEQFFETLMKAVSPIRESVDAEFKLASRVVLEQKSALVATWVRVDHLRRILRDSTAKRVSFHALLSDMRSQLDEMNGRDLDSWDPSRADRNIRAARLQAALGVATSNWNPQFVGNL